MLNILLCLLKLSSLWHGFKQCFNQTDEEKHGAEWSSHLVAHRGREVFRMFRLLHFFCCHFFIQFGFDFLGYIKKEDSNGSKPHENLALHLDSEELAFV